jgi:hypothetical protein
MTGEQKEALAGQTSASLKTHSCKGGKNHLTIYICQFIPELKL